jgi:hypothetical protein
MPLISARITDTNGIDNTRVTMTLDGTRVGSFIPTTGVVSFDTDYVLTEGSHTVVVSAFDNYNNPKAATWNFTVLDTPPQILNVLPPDQTGLRTARPIISAKVADASGLSVGQLGITVDGAPLTVSFQPDQPGSTVGGTVSGTPAGDLSSAMHTAVVTVVDVRGNTVQKTWQFGVNTFVDMAADFVNCTGCHNEGPAQLESIHAANSGNCSACHGRAIYSVDGCEDCHSHTWDIPLPLSSYSCTQCHNSSYWDVVPTHGSPAMATTHNYDQLGQDCSACHSAALTKSHNIYTEGQPVNNCNTCHQSSNTTVQNAISTGNLACAACHGDAGNHPQKHQNSIDASCQSCHANNLVDDHITNRAALGYNCQTCHNTNVMPTAGIGAAPNLQCSRCHDTAHDVKTVPLIPSDIPLYDELIWSVPFEAGIYTGETWMPLEYLAGGRLLVSKRVTDITGKAIRDYYKTTLESNGWTLASALPGDESNFYDLTFTLNGRKVRVSFYGGENHTASPLVPAGYRVEILYK